MAERGQQTARAERVRWARRAGAHASAGIDDPSRSVRIACVVWAGLWSIGLLMNNVVGPWISPDKPLDDAWPIPANPVAFGCIALSAALYAYASRRESPPHRLSNLALGYEVFLALGIGIVNQWTPNIQGLSWICVVVLVHPLIIPTPPVKTLVASLVAASMDLVGLWIAGERGVELPERSVVLWTYLPNYLCAFLAVVPSRVRGRMEEHRQAAKELGSYRVGELLGRGGMGEVYVAEHRMLARPAAIKLMRPEMLSAVDGEARHAVVGRFEREAKVTAGLRSPHTVHVYDYGVSDEGRLYYVMELLQGLDLEAFVRDHGPIPPERAIHLLLQMCDSLAEAHERGLVHRDIKPSNVHVCRYGRRFDFVKVVDFGLAKPIRLPDAASGLTRDSAIPGTPAFMAPEQIMGTKVGPAIDLYAMGCLAHWLLTGRLVFEGASPFDVIAQHARSEPLPPSQSSEFVIPDELDRIVVRCLAKDPGRRPPSADALADLLSAVPVDTPWTDERARRWWEEHVPNLAANVSPSIPSASIVVE